MSTERTKRGGEIFLLKPSELIFEEGFNKRKKYTEIPELAQSIREQGQVVPIQVYKIRSGDNKGKYFVRIGHRRTMASQLIAEKDKNFLVKAICLAKNDPIENLLLQFTSQTEVPLNSIEKGNLIVSLREVMTGKDKDKEIQSKLGISQAQMYNLMKLTTAPESVQEAIMDDEISGTTVNQLIRQFSEGKVLDAAGLEKSVKEAISDAQNNPEKGNKGTKATSSNLNKKVSLEKKIKQLLWLHKKKEVKSEALNQFAEVIALLETPDLTIESIMENL